MQKHWKELVHFVHFVAGRFARDRCAQMSASLTFTTLLSLVPLITIALTVFSAFPVFADFSAQIKGFLLSNMMPETGGKLITRYMEQFAESAGRLTAVGVILLGVTAMLLMLTIDNAFNTIWRVSRPRPMFRRILTYWAVLTLAPLLIGASLSLTSWLLGMSVGYAHQLPAFGVLLLKLVSLLFTTAAFSLLFRLVPNRLVPVRHALIGGLVAALLFELMGRGFGLYISHFPTYKLVYGAFASVPIFLMWVYCSWLTILVGAVVAASLSYWSGVKEHEPGSAAQLYYALRILREMGEGMHDGKVLTLSVLSRQLRLGFDQVEQLLDRLDEAGIVHRLDGEGWGLIRDLEHVQLDELRRLFVYDLKEVEMQRDDGGVGEWLAHAESRNGQAAQIALNVLFAEAAGARATAE